MKDKKRNKIPFLTQFSSSPLKSEETSLSSVLASVQSLPTPSEKKQRKEQEDNSQIELYLTVYSKVFMTRKQLCLVSGLLLSQICAQGVNINDVIVLEYLHSRILGQKLKPDSLKESRELEIVLAIQSLLFGLKELSLDTEKVNIPEDIANFIKSSRYIPNSRTSASWKEKYPVHKFLTVKTVRIENIYEKSSSSVPYDSYCKGYGETGPNQHKKKTRSSPDLDGEKVDIVKEGSIAIPLFSISYYIHYQELEMKFTGMIR